MRAGETADARPIPGLEGLALAIVKQAKVDLEALYREMVNARERAEREAGVSTVWDERYRELDRERRQLERWLLSEDCDLLAQSGPGHHAGAYIVRKCREWARKGGVTV